MLKISAATLLILAIVPISARAAPAPAALLGKSVVLTWSETRLQRRLGDQNFRSVNASHNLSMYISTAGRVFIRQTIRTLRSWVGRPGFRFSAISHGSEFCGTNGDAVLALSNRWNAPASHDFDAAFDACTATVAFAKEVGRETAITGSLIDKRHLVEMQSIAVANVTCAVQSGNVFGS